MLKRIFGWCFLLVWSMSLFAQTKNDSVTINGLVTDYAGNPLDSVTVAWQRLDFSIATKAMTDKNGRYTAQVPKGKYQSVFGVNMAKYLHTAPASLPEADQRLEFWGWDFIADKDTTLNFSYYRMEAYGLRTFCIPGARPVYQIYVRPLSLTRFHAWKKAGQSYVDVIMAPSSENLKAVVWIDGEEVPVVLKQEIREYFGPGQSGNSYLLTVPFPKTETNNSYRIFKVELTDLENGDQGEGLYYMEKENYK